MPEKIAWLHEQGCAVCGARPVEVHHERRRGGRADDRQTIPLCPAHHRTDRKSRHVLGGYGFEVCHGVYLDGLCAEYQRRWEDRF
jgi:hypothetical protein